MILNYIWCKNGKMHYNTLAGFNANGKWTFTDVLQDNYVLEGEYEFIYNLEENYFAIVCSAEKYKLDYCKGMMVLELTALKHNLEFSIKDIENVRELLGGN